MSRFERWTRRMLENEAQRRGVQAPERKPSGELLAAIVQQDAGIARKVVRSLVQSAGAVFGKRFAREPHGVHGAQAARPREPAALPSPLPPPPAPQPMAATTRLRQERDAAELKLFWQVSKQSAESAQKVLGGPGELALRVVAVRADATHIVASEITDHGPIPASGEWHLVLPSADAHCVSAVGLRHGERFVSIAHQSSRASR